jgi:hypothetical protein
MNRICNDELISLKRIYLEVFGVEINDKIAKQISEILVDLSEETYQIIEY